MRLEPFVCDVPHSIHFSGGATSGMMLRLHLDAHGGRLPEGVQVLFCNTGKERIETLRFVELCSLEWEVPVTWLEYRFRPGEKPFHSFEVVNYATASRQGEPFADAIKARRYLPNPVARFCTVELKIRTAARHMRSLGHDHWTSSIGLRADEPARVSRLRGTNRHAHEEPTCPLATAGYTLGDVARFWDQQPFRLALKAWEGNCDLCFLKGRTKITQILRDRPDLADWWIRLEEDATFGTGRRSPTFRADRPSYRRLLRETQSQPLLPFADDDEPLLDCFCGE